MAALAWQQWPVGLGCAAYFCSSFSLTLDSFSRTSLALSSEAQEALLFTVSGMVGKPSLIKKFKNIFDIDHPSLSLCWLIREGKFSPSQGQFSHGMTASRGYEANTCFPSKRTLWSIHRYTLFPNGPWMCLLGLVFNGYIYCFRDRSKNFPRPFLYIDILGIYA